jgi:renalase
MDNRSDDARASRVAIIGAGLAGAACARALVDAGVDVCMSVTVFEKSRGSGGRMATRRASYVDAQGAEQTADFDHGAPYFAVTHPAFREVIAQAERAGCVVPWHPRIRGQWPVLASLNIFVSAPNMPALARHLLDGISVQAGLQVQKLLQSNTGWQLLFTDGSTSTMFDHVVLAIPPAQAAALLADHQREWSNKLAALKMNPCWTLMVVTDHIDLDWDLMNGDGGVLSLIVRNDHKPTRAAPPACATWVVHASTEWSVKHLEDDPQVVTDALVAAFEREMPRGLKFRYHYRAVHRWRYAQRSTAVKTDAASWSDAMLGLSVCGDFLSSAGVEGAWLSGMRAGAELIGGSIQRATEVAGKV